MNAITTDVPTRATTATTAWHGDNLNQVHQMRPDVIEELLNLADDLNNVQLQPYSDQLTSDSDNNTNSYKLVLACMLILAGVCALVTVVVITGFMYQKSRRRRSYDSSFCGSEYPSDYYLQTETTLSETTDKSPLSEHSTICGGLTPVTNPAYCDESQFPDVTSINPDHVCKPRDNKTCKVLIEESQSTCSTISHGTQETAAILGPGITSVYQGLLTE